MSKKVVFNFGAFPPKVAVHYVLPMILGPNKGLPPVAAPIFLNFYLDDLDRAFQCDFFPGARYGEEGLLPFLSQKEEKCTIQQITELMTELDLLYRIIEVETGGPFFL